MPVPTATSELCKAHALISSEMSLVVCLAVKLYNPKLLWGRSQLCPNGPHHDAGCTDWCVVQSCQFGKCMLLTACDDAMVNVKQHICCRERSKHQSFALDCQHQCLWSMLTPQLLLYWSLSALPSCHHCIAASRKCGATSKETHQTGADHGCLKGLDQQG